MADSLSESAGNAYATLTCEQIDRARVTNARVTAIGVLVRSRNIVSISVKYSSTGEGGMIDSDQIRPQKLARICEL
jgi:hypothetical protein